MANRLINILDRVSPDERSAVFENQHRFVRQQIDLVGGWLPDIDEAYRPRLVGAYAFDQVATHRLQLLAEATGALFHAVGTHIHRDAASLTSGEFWERYAFLAIPEAYRSTLDTLPRRFFSTPLIRPDVLIDSDGRPWIAEVNTGSVGGPEDLLMYLRHLEGLPEWLDADELQSVRGQIRRLLSTMRNWLDHQYDLFLMRVNGLGNREFSSAPQIAVVYADREDSFFVAKYLASIYAHLGYRSVHCRPEHLLVDNDRLCIAAPVSGERIPIDIVYRDFIFEEMFEPAGDELRLRDEFMALLEAAQRELVLLLNPLQDFLLRSKAVIPALFEEEALSDSGLAALRDRFSEFCPLTRFARPGLAADAEMVLKPTLGHGGRGVMVDQEKIAELLRTEAPEDLYPHWIVQRKIAVERITSSFGAGTEPSGCELRFVHGLLIHRVEAGWRATGVLTKGGPGEVINFSGGAQMLPGLLSAPSSDI